MPVTVDAVKTHLGLQPASTVDAAAMQQAVDAVNAAAVRILGVDAAGPWTADVDEGGVLLAARVYGRRGSVSGVAGFADLGVAYIARFDPDVAWLWGIGDYQSPVIA